MSGQGRLVDLASSPTGMGDLETTLATVAPGVRVTGLRHITWLRHAKDLSGWEANGVLHGWRWTMWAFSRGELDGMYESVDVEFHFPGSQTRLLVLSVLEGRRLDWGTISECFLAPLVAPSVDIPFHLRFSPAPPYQGDQSYSFGLNPSRIEATRMRRPLDESTRVVREPGGSEPHLAGGHLNPDLPLPRFHTWVAGYPGGPLDTDWDPDDGSHWTPRPHPDTPCDLCQRDVVRSTKPGPGARLWDGIHLRGML